MTNRNFANRKQQSGVFLLEALIAILIFSMGILAIVGLQAASVKASGDATYRTNASLLANELIGQMWSGNRVGTILQTNFQGDGDGEGADAGVVTADDGPLFTAWLPRVVAALPNGSATVQITPGAPGDLINLRTASTVTVTVRWLAPNDAVGHEYSAIVSII
jgi:type IV pilus assembly protein PilV